VVDAFFAAARGGNFDALVAALDPDVVLRSDGGEARRSVVIRGAGDVARRAIAYALPTALLQPAVVNGALGVIVTVRERTISVMGFTVTNGKIVEIVVITDPRRLDKIDPAVFDGRDAGRGG